MRTPLQKMINLIQSISFASILLLLALRSIAFSTWALPFINLTRQCIFYWSRSNWMSTEDLLVCCWEELLEDDFSLNPLLLKFNPLNSKFYKVSPFVWVKSDWLLSTRLFFLIPPDFLLFLKPETLSIYWWAFLIAVAW